MSTPWPLHVHPILVECVSILCDVFGMKVRVAYAKPYFGYRSFEEQDALYSQGRSSLWEVNMFRQRVGWAPLTENENKRTVTNARGGQSQHNHMPARAADLVIVRADRGHLVWDAGIDLDDDGVADYIELGEIGEGIGLVWGGRFKMRDWGHFELPSEEADKMRALYEKFAPEEVEEERVNYA